MKHFLTICLLLLILYFIQNMEYFHARDPVLDELQKQLATIDPKFGNVELYSGKKSYTINKSQVFICTKDKKGRYYNRNMLMYVLLHEIAHMECDELNHTPKFYTIFDKLLKRAATAKLYNPSIPPLTDYCGH